MSRAAFAPIFFASILALARIASAEPQLIVGDPFELDEPVPGTGGWPFLFPEIAASDGGFLAVWAGYGAGSRLDAETLAPLDPGGLPSLEMFGTMTSLHVESNGATYFVLDVDVASCESGGGCLMGLLIDAETGEAISDKISLAPDAGGSVPLAALAGTYGGDYLISWVRNSGLPTLHATRIDGSTGALLDGESGFDLCSAGSYVHNLTSAANADGALIAFDDGEEVRAVRVLWDGSVPDPDGFVLEGVENHLENYLVAAGAGFVVVWNWYVATNAAVFAAIVDPESGATSGPVVLYGSPDEGVIIFSSCVAALGAGASAAVVWSEEDVGEGSASDDVYGVLLDVGGSIEVSERFAIAEAEGEQGAPGVAFRDGAYAAVWEDSRTGSVQIWGTRFDATGLLLADAVPLGTAPNDEREPRVAGSSEGFFAAWWDTRYRATTGDAFMGARIDPLAEEATAIVDGIAPKDLRTSLAATIDTGDSAYALWGRYDPNANTTTFGNAKIDPATGEVLSRGELLVPSLNEDWETAPIAPIVLGGELFVVYADGRRLKGAFWGDPEAPQLLAEPLHSAPAAVDPEGGTAFWDVRAAVSGTTMLVLWEECYSSTADPAKGGGGGFWSCEHRARRFDVSVPDDPQPVEETIELLKWTTGEYALASAGESIYAFYTMNDSDTTSRLRAIAFPADTSDATGFDVSEALRDVAGFDRKVVAPAAVAVGGGIVIAAVGSVPTEFEGLYTYGVFGMAVDEALSVVAEPTPIGPGGTGSPPSRQFAIAASGDRVLCVQEAELYGSARVMGRMLGPVEFGLDDGGPGDGSTEVRASAGCSCAAAGARPARGGLLSILLK
ncbi:MAG: hypothetical protein M0R80_30260 [Proteobacteria bacterium]|jgi:hypothetical protein|nr:hypothetical protein [Pseudomonadota bacterium]